MKNNLASQLQAHLEDSLTMPRFDLELKIFVNLLKVKIQSTSSLKTKSQDTGAPL